MKIKFDIKYRPQIECGKYKVVNQEGTPVTIERWDLKGNYPILAILKLASDKYYQLYIDTGDDLTEAERILYNLVNDHVNNRDSIDEDEVREWMKENFLPALINDCETNGDYFTADGIKYLNIKNYSDGL